MKEGIKKIIKKIDQLGEMIKEKFKNTFKKIKEKSKKACRFICKHHLVILSILFLTIPAITGRIYTIIPLVIMPILLIINYHIILKRKRNELNNIIKNYNEMCDQIIETNNTLKDELQRITEIKLHLLKLGVIVPEEKNN